MKFRVGDVVAFRHGSVDWLQELDGKPGVVRAPADGRGRLAIEFSRPFILGHACDGLASPGRGRWAMEGGIEAVECHRRKA